MTIRPAAWSASVAPVVFAESFRRGTRADSGSRLRLYGTVRKSNRKAGPHVTGTLAIVLIIVVWLFVLAPLLLRGQKPIRKAGEAFDEPRVIHEGGSGELRSRRRPRVTPADVRTSREESNEDYELIDDDDVLIDDRADDDAGHRSGLGGVFGRASARFRAREDAEQVPAEGQVVDGDLIHELESAPVESDAALTTTAEVESEEAPGRGDLGLVYTEEFDDDYGEEKQYYRYSEAYTSPADLMDERAALDRAEEEEPAADVVDEAAEPGSTAARRGRDRREPGPDLTEEELEFAQRRRGRGGWDPEADQNQSTTRYQRRQRTLLSLAAVVVLTVIAAVIFGGWGWVLPVIALAVTATYLVALRSQVREEQALRARRIRQLRRSRLGVRLAPEGERSVPRQLRRPGAVVLEVDDESPDFEHLETTRFDLPVYRDGDRVNEPINLNDRRVS